MLNVTRPSRNNKMKMAVSFQTIILMLCLSVDNHGVIAKKIILKKCCPFKSYVNESLQTLKKSCNEVGSNLNFADLKVYDSGDLHLTDRSVKDVFELNFTGVFDDQGFKNSAFDYYRLFRFQMLLVETGILYLESPNEYPLWRKVNSSNFCVDYLITEDEPPMPRIWAIVPREDTPAHDPIYITVGLLISCVFLALVLVVYLLIPELRNPKGLILMAYVATLFTAFLLLAVLQLVQDLAPLGCQLLTYSIYFSFLAIFCWMNVMSFDIWWTISTRDRARFKFRVYCAYAFGVPLAMTAFFVTMDHVPMRHLPWFITPKVLERGRFIKGYAKLVYLYAPMLVLILLNWAFFLMTSFELWSHHRKTVVLDTAGAGPPPAHRQHRARFLLYLKLSLIMGINWILEVVSSFCPDLPIWVATDLYNILIGLSIFLIFVCDRSTLRKLEKRFRMIHESTAVAGEHRILHSTSSGSQSSHTTSSDASQEVFLHPDGTSKQDIIL